MDVIRRWVERYMADPQVVILALVLVVGFVIVLTMGQMLAPVLAALVLILYFLAAKHEPLHLKDALQESGDRPQGQIT